MRSFLGRGDLCVSPPVLSFSPKQGGKRKKQENTRQNSHRNAKSTLVVRVVVHGSFMPCPLEWARAKTGELTEGCYSKGYSQGFPLSSNTHFLGYPLSFFNSNSTLIGRMWSDVSGDPVWKM